MKVNKLVEILKTMPQDTDVLVELRQSKNVMELRKVKYCEELKSVCLIANWRDFELDEDAIYDIEQQLDEEAKQDAVDTMIDQALGK